MAKQSAKKIGWVAATCVLIMSLMATPARAGHEPDIVVPVVAAFALGTLWSHGHGDHYYRQGYRYERRGYYRHGNHGHGYSHKRNYSKGNYNHGYSHKKHYSQGQASYRPRQGHGSNNGHGQKHGSKRAGHTSSRRKH
jgi:hypothetical protein